MFRSFFLCLPRGPFFQLVPSFVQPGFLRLLPFLLSFHLICLPRLVLFSLPFRLWFSSLDDTVLQTCASLSCFRQATLSKTYCTLQRLRTGGATLSKEGGPARELGFRRVAIQLPLADAIFLLSCSLRLSQPRSSLREWRSSGSLR